MPAYIFNCKIHGEQERFQCKVGQLDIACENKECKEVATRESKPHRMSFSCEGGCDSYFKGK